MYLVHTEQWRQIFKHMSIISPFNCTYRIQAKNIIQKQINKNHKLVTGKHHLPLQHFALIFFTYLPESQIIQTNYFIIFTCLNPVLLVPGFGQVV
jgi:hypothetical protein